MFRNNLGKPKTIQKVNDEFGLLLDAQILSLFGPRKILDSA